MSIMSIMSNRVIAEALREYGQAFRGDWSSSTIDGRSVRDEMAQVADALVGGEDADKPLEWWRATLGVCPHGMGHWAQHCDEGCQALTERWEQG